MIRCNSVELFHPKIVLCRNASEGVEMAGAEQHSSRYVRSFLSLVHKLELNWPLSMVLILIAFIVLWELKRR